MAKYQKYTAPGSNNSKFLKSKTTAGKMFQSSSMQNFLEVSKDSQG